MDTQSSTERTQNYSQDQDIALCHACMNASLDASVGTDQTKERYWSSIEDSYCNTMTVSSNHTQDSHGHRLAPSKSNATGGPVVLVKSTMHH